MLSDGCGSSANTGMAPPMPNSAAFSSASIGECIAPVGATERGRNRRVRNDGHECEQRRRTIAARWMPSTNAVRAAVANASAAAVGELLGDVQRAGQ